MTMNLAPLVGQLLPALDRAFPISIVPVLDAFLRDNAHALGSAVLLVDYDLAHLRQLEPGSPVRPIEDHLVDDSDAGRAFVLQQPVTVQGAGSARTYVPITLRAERLGVLEVVTDAMPEPVLLDALWQTATVLAYVVTIAGNYTDLLELARRRKELSLPAEMQWAQQPVRAYSSSEFSVVGQLVPAYDVGGDLFDFVVSDGFLGLSVTDAMGHGLRASLLAGLARSALRNARRAGQSPAGQVRAASQYVFQQFGGEQFVTGLVVRLDIRSGHGVAVVAGHPTPVLIRNGQIVPVEFRHDLPMGLFEAPDYAEQRIKLQPGDRLVFVSDGVLEAAPPGGEEFGPDRLEGALLANSLVSPHEAVRHLVSTLLAYQAGELRDDATVVCLDWRGPPSRR